MALQLLNRISYPILKNAVWQKELDTEGVVKFPFLSEQTVQTLLDFYYAMHPTPPKGPIPGFYISVHSPDLAYKLKIQDTINRLILPYCETHFMDYSLASTAMLVKQASAQSELIFHQDWNATDEALFSAYTFWIPLIDTTVQNGTLFVIKRSHRIGPTYRSASLPSIYSQIGSTLKKYLEPIEVKAGEAVLFDKSILHESPPNLGPIARPTIVSTLLPKQADFLNYAYTDKATSTISAYKVNPDFVQYYDSFFEESMRLPANAAPFGDPFVVDFTPIEEQEFNALYQPLLT